MSDSIFAPDDVQRLDNVLTDTSMAPVTRRSLVAKAAAGATGLGALGALGPIPSALASSNSIVSIINDAVTAEALAVTFLTGVVENASKIGIPSSLVPVLKAANAAEFDHYKALRGLGAKPLTTKFWAPNSFFASSQAVFETIEYAETQFVNAYLIAITAFAKAGKGSFARYAGEILGTEAEHRALARFAQGKLPNNVSFEDYSIKSMSGIVAALQKAGIGFGKQGATPGKFYTFAPPPPSTVTAINGNAPA
jgi:Ferritin-like domain